jgi:proline iminopeptidase
MPLPIPAPRDSGYTHSTSVPLYWCAYGPSGGERLLVLHGGPGAHHDYLLPQMLGLASRREMLFYDQRGGGRSRADNTTPVTWQILVDDLRSLVRELGLKPLSILGYSWGALLALLYLIEAARHPQMERPRRLVLIDPAPLSRPFRDVFDAEFSRRQRSEAIRELREDLADSGLRESDPETYRQRQFEVGVAPYFARPEATRDLTPFRVTARVQQSVWESLGDYDVIPALATSHVPTLFVHGRHDPIPLESTDQAARAMHARLLVLEASGHVPYVEQPGTLFSAIEQFLEDTSAIHE